MNSGTRKREAAHRRATRLAAERPCLACDLPAPSEPCHYPTHRGMGSGKAGWDPLAWVPLCRTCHDALDERNGHSYAATIATARVRARVGRRAPGWWRLFQ